MSERGLVFRSLLVKVGSDLLGREFQILDAKYPSNAP